MIPTEAVRSRIAVFIDFDNVEIGVKSTLGEHFPRCRIVETYQSFEADDGGRAIAQVVRRHPYSG